MDRVNLISMREEFWRGLMMGERKDVEKSYLLSFRKWE